MSEGKYMSGAALTDGAEPNDRTLQQALDVANIPILLMVLFQLTGDDKWLKEPYSPTRARGLDTNPTGGLVGEIQATIRRAAKDAILKWHRGERPALPEPTGKTLTCMLSVCVGEQVDDEYAELLAHEMGFQRWPFPKPATQEQHSPTQPTAIVVGAGVSGIAASVYLQAAGIDHTILEKRQRIGGTWVANEYPGSGVDTPSYLYSYSFSPTEWSSFFARQPDVQAYLQEVAEKFGVARRIKFGREVSDAQFDEKAKCWRVRHTGDEGDEELEAADYLITAVGLLSRPKIPTIEGRDRYSGVSFHSAEWPAGFDIAGKRVAVIGSGASAMQIAPSIVQRAKELTILQRSPHWIAPNDEVGKAVDERIHWLHQHVPYYSSWYRAMLWWLFGDRVHDSLRIDPDWSETSRSVNETNEGHRQFFTRYAEDKLADRPELLSKTIPSYPPFGKRMLLDYGWFDALLEPNCRLIDSRIDHFVEEGLVTDDGQLVDADVVVFATGFDAKNLLAPMRVIGRDGRSLRQEWGEEDPAAYLGMTVPGFPNLFVMYGPNTNLGHGGSYIFLAEAQAHYIADLLSKLSSRGSRTAECRRDVHDEYNRAMDREHSKLIWSHPGMDTWYRNSKGRVVTNSPWRLVDFWKMTREADLDDYQLS